MTLPDLREKDEVLVAGIYVAINIHFSQITGAKKIRVVIKSKGESSLEEFI